MAFRSNILVPAARRERSHVGIGAMLMALVLLSIASVVLAIDDWNPLTPRLVPHARYGHSMVTRPDGTPILFGGKDPGGELLNDLCVFEDDDWNPVRSTGSAPKARYGHIMVVMPDGNILVFGGEDAAGNVLNDLYSLENQNWRRIVPSNAPPPARAVPSAWEYDGKLYIAGGRGEDDQRLSDIWEYDPNSNGWQQGPNAPSDYDLWGAGAVTFGDTVYFLGPNEDVPYFDYGADGEFGTSDDRWGAESTYITTSGGPKAAPVKRFAAVTQIGDTAYMVGGYKEGYGVTTCTFSFDPMLMPYVWRYLGATPVPLWQAAAGEYEGGILLFGGLKPDGTVNEETYVFRR